jgi:hypothetical protein
MKTDHQKLIYSKMWWFWKLFTACEGNKNVENNKRDIQLSSIDLVNDCIVFIQFMKSEFGTLLFDVYICRMCKPIFLIKFKIKLAFVTWKLKFYVVYKLFQTILEIKL